MVVVVGGVESRYDSMDFWTEWISFKGIIWAWEPRSFDEVWVVLGFSLLGFYKGW